jgi:hypothetical protein
MASLKIRSYKNGTEFVEVTYLKSEGSNQVFIISVATSTVVSINGVST